MNKFLVSFFIFILIGCVNSSQQTNKSELPSMNEVRLQTDMYFLADDSLKGRKPGTEGYQIAANYVAERFRTLGLKAGGDNGSYLQEVAFQKYKVERDSIKLTIASKNKQQLLSFGDDFTLLVNSNFANVDIKGELIWAGFGLDAPELGVNSYNGIDVKGKIVVVVPMLPNNVGKLERSYYSDKRQLDAVNRGAVAVVTLRYLPPKIRKIYAERKAKAEEKALATGKAIPKPRILPAPQMENFINSNGQISTKTSGLPVSIRLKFDATVDLLSSVNLDIDELAKLIKAGDMPSVDLSGTFLDINYKGTVSPSYSSHNVVGILPGSDSKLKDEYLVLTAHLDHLGYRPNIKNEDKIFNGLMDNASGVASILEMARHFSALKTPPKRSIIFVALTNEETGLQGADFFAKYPNLDKGKIVANINIDMPILTYDFADVVAFGAEHSNLGEYVEAAAKKINISLSPDPMPKKNIFFRSDHFRFVQQGIPSIMLMSGFTSTTPETIDGKKMFYEFYGNHYHRPSDDKDAPILWDVAAKFTLVNYLIAQEVANSAITPHWNENSFFEMAYKK